LNYYRIVEQFNLTV